MTPSTAGMRANVASDRVVPCSARLFRPMSWVSKVRSKPSVLSAACRTCRVGGVISGPMPSPGRTRISQLMAFLASLEVGGQRFWIPHTVDVRPPSGSASNPLTVCLGHHFSRTIGFLQVHKTTYSDEIRGNPVLAIRHAVVSVLKRTQTSPARDAATAKIGIKYLQNPI